MNILPIDLQKIILDYKEQLDISEKKKRLLKELKREYTYEFNGDFDEYGKSTINFRDYDYEYTNTICVDGKIRFKVDYINPTFITKLDYNNQHENLKHIVSYVLNPENKNKSEKMYFAEDYFECHSCWSLTCSGCYDIIYNEIEYDSDCRKMDIIKKRWRNNNWRNNDESSDESNYDSDSSIEY